jgi:putative ABC transport system substrate-binding protein
MDRRAFLGTLTGTLLAAPLAAEAQPARRRVPLVGLLQQGHPSDPMRLRTADALRQGLREHGHYVEGQNIAIEYRYGDADALQSLANDLVRLNVDVIVAGGTPAAIAAKRATNTIPVVVANMADAVGDRLVVSLARLGGNVTGNTFLGPELGPKRLQLLREVIPRVSRVAALQHPGVYGERTMRDMLKELEKTARTIGVELQVVGANSPNDFENAFAEMGKGHAAALIVFPSPMFYTEHRLLVDFAAKHRLPAIYVFREAVDVGGLMAYGASIPDLFRRAAAYVDRILKGAKPADLPVEQPTKFELVINLKTAKALGLTIPPSLLQRADQVIE